MIMKQALTFDDVLLVPQKSNILPSQVNVQAKLTPKIKLNLPLISADMDTVTEAPLAIALARLGGLGIIHKNLSLAKQVREIKRVKRSESGVITNPFTLGPQNSVKDAIVLMKKYNISGIPIIMKGGKLVGVLTRRDLRFENNLEAKIKSRMTKTLITAPLGTTIEKAKDILHKNRIEKLPLVDKDGSLGGLITIKDIQKIIDYPSALKDNRGRLIVGASVGVGKEASRRSQALIKAGVDLVVISTAHGHSETVVETVKNLKEKFPHLEIIAGNVVTKEAVYDLVRAGADAIKIGVGPGSTCTTRIVTGVGMPQVTATQDCAKEARKKGVSVIADGGIRYSGDIIKALAAGAQAVMIGGLFAGTEEAPGELFYLEGKAYKSYRGMGSLEALESGSRERYGQDSRAVTVPQGVEGRILYKGSLKKVTEQLIGGLKAGMGMVGTKTIAELQKKARFVTTTQAGVKEGHPHDITITKETPNYPGRI